MAHFSRLFAVTPLGVLVFLLVGSAHGAGPPADTSKPDDGASDVPDIEFHVAPITQVGGHVPNLLSIGGEFAPTLRWPNLSLALGGRYVYAAVGKVLYDVPVTGAEITTFGEGCLHLSAFRFCSLLGIGNLWADSVKPTWIELKNPITGFVGFRFGGEWRLSRHFKLDGFVEAPISVGHSVWIFESGHLWTPFPVSLVAGAGFSFGRPTDPKRWREKQREVGAR